MELKQDQTMTTAGVDVGTAAIKVVFAGGNEILWSESTPTVPPCAQTARYLFEQGLAELSLTEQDLSAVVATGYGRRSFPDAHETIDEITANALGAYTLSEGAARTVINVGGQDMKVIEVTAPGSALDFRMNDKCAAGTGRFFEMAARILDTPVHQFGELGLLSQTPATLNSTCVVFAESEMLSLISMGADKSDLIQGLHQSVAARIADLAYGFTIEPAVYLDGGPGGNVGLIAALQDELGCDVLVFPQPQFTVAFGAAVAGRGGQVLQ